MKAWVLSLAAILALSCAAPGRCEPSSPAGITAVGEALSRPAQLVGDLSRILILDAAVNGNRIIAVGERGVVMLSDDGGLQWRQAKSVPVSVTLTALRFVDSRKAWAVGHGGVVLHSVDAGETWSLQLDGIRAATLAMAAAQQDLQAKPDDPTAQRLLKAATLLVNDGPDKPLLDLTFTDAQNGVVIGAYGLIYATDDGGQHWKPWMQRTDNPKGLHLYAISGVGGALVIVGERGLVLRSPAPGQPFARVASPYAGSWFATARASDGSLVAAGLRGHVAASADGGVTWRELSGAPPVSFLSVVPHPTSGLVFANQAGQLYTVTDGGAGMLRPLAAAAVPSLTKLIALPDGALLALTARGALRLKAPAAVASSQARP